MCRLGSEVQIPRNQCECDITLAEVRDQQPMFNLQKIEDIGLFVSGPGNLQILFVFFCFLERLETLLSICMHT